MDALTDLELELTPDMTEGQVSETEEQDPAETEDEEEDSTEESEEDGAETEEETEESEEDGQVESETMTISAKEYKELRKFATQKSMEAAEYKKQLSQATEHPVTTLPNTPTTTQEQPQGNHLEQYIAKEVARGLQEYIEPLQQQQTDLRLQTTVQALSEKYNDFEDVAPSFIEALEENPELLDMDNGLEIAYKAARADYLLLVAEAKAKAAVESSKRSVAEKTANTEKAGAAKAQSKEAAQTEADAIAASILGSGGRSSIFG